MQHAASPTSRLCGPAAADEPVCRLSHLTLLLPVSPSREPAVHPAPAAVPAQTRAGLPAGPGDCIYYCMHACNALLYAPSARAASIRTLWRSGRGSAGNGGRGWGVGSVDVRFRRSVRALRRGVHGSAMTCRPSVPGRRGLSTLTTGSLRSPRHGWLS
ncbi:hypothetical protein CALCODRAFT_301225 [Calocera cornea HHB12733]|uniref:Uncharacterized protein n=1 Tax=Calocera cornea HHB12733 TaxID=1353952 RepID=A0A165FHZ6_9BASI|nr:hypothetical protein CALCODRAFT_301225 [Calocera cornea HHB12733]